MPSVREGEDWVPAQEETGLLPQPSLQPEHIRLHLEQGTRACGGLDMTPVGFWTNRVTLASFQVPFWPVPCKAVAGAAGAGTGLCQSPASATEALPFLPPPSLQLAASPAQTSADSLNFSIQSSFQC